MVLGRMALLSRLAYQKKNEKIVEKRPVGS